jgi:hypothetical protein
MVGTESREETNQGLAILSPTTAPLPLYFTSNSATSG